MIARIKCNPVIRPPTPIMLAFNCSFAYFAVVVSRTSATRAPGTLLADAEIPTPVPQRTIPRSASPFTTFSAVFLPKIG